MALQDAWVFLKAGFVPNPDGTIDWPVEGGSSPGPSPWTPPQPRPMYPCPTCGGSGAIGGGRSPREPPYEPPAPWPRQGPNDPGMGQPDFPQRGPGFNHQGKPMQNRVTVEEANKRKWLPGDSKKWLPGDGQ